ncbi:MutS-related protein [Roseivirga echinicomitans]|uniref:DNA mismatch repair proteins mutS family domain-containing protein n=1 Tax=Roseivirga echinicomitans TaxID=296218 RepID=A0A150X9P5_9BACT|nr:hypothetical protein [Roseivirga echinicomitans]KYG75459.1 hypothetical protein AWN68_07895 [Roseivirga echinicomitans]
MFKSTAKKREELFQEQIKVKRENFNFELIQQFWSKHPNQPDEHFVADRTARDLDLDEVFIFLDRTTSRVGQQYLYRLLRTIPKSNARANEQEKLVGKFRDDLNLKKSCIQELSKLKKKEAYRICTLFQDEQLKKPKWFWVIQMLAFLSLSCLIGAIFYPVLWIAFIFIFIANFTLHYWNKKNVFRYGNSIPQLLRLIQVSKTIRKLTKTQSPDLDESIQKLDQIANRLSVFRLEDKLQSDVSQIAEYIVEMTRVAFLIEPILLFHSLKKLESRKSNIETLFSFTGKMDVAICMDTLRSTVDNYCMPVFNEREKAISALNIYHPLIIAPVENSIQTKEKSVLLTGSNMSGKTTFIRTIGINCLVGQTLNMCFASEFHMNKMNIQTAIHMADDLMSDKSYYYEEVLSIKNILDESQSEQENLFLLDELFKGTNTLERIATGKAVLSYLHNIKNTVFIATHDLELVDYLKNQYDLYHFSENVENDEINFDYKLKEGKLRNTNAIKILAANGYPKAVISEAYNMVSTLKQKGSETNLS